MLGSFVLREGLIFRSRDRKKVSYSWAEPVQIAEYIGKADNVREGEPYSAMILLTAASGLRASELAGLQRQSGTFTTWAQITCVILLTGIDQG